MVARGAVAGLLVAACVVFSGCGSSGSGPLPGLPVGGETVSLGTLQVGVASAAGFKRLALTSPAGSRVAFTALYGSKIVRLQEMGYGKIAFDTERGGNREIYVMNADGSGQTNLTKNPMNDYEPAWSPNGRRIAFHTDPGGNDEIYVMNADGSGQTNLTKKAAQDNRPAWSPNGRQIAFETYRGGNYEIYVMNADGSGQTNLTKNAAHDYNPAWSPNGGQIAFQRQRSGNYEIYVMNADGSGQTNLTKNAADDFSPAWSPNGRQIAFETYRGSNWEIYVMNADGSGQTNLTKKAADDYNPAWSPNGRQIAFSTFRGGNYEIYVMNADGSGQANLTSHAADDRDPAWCPAPSAKRTLIGAPGADGGTNPPFGVERPLAIVGLTADGLVSATTIGIGPQNWSTLKVAALRNIGTDLAGVEITGNKISSVLEDMGRGLTPRTWNVSDTPTTGAVLIFFSGETGKVSSIMAIADTALTTASGAGEMTTAQLRSGRVVLEGDFVEAYAADNPSRNLVGSKARIIVLDERTGEVLSVK